MRVALFQPDIALNVGSVLRTAACLNCPVDIILPCGFPFSAKSLARSGMDYLDMADYTAHPSWEHFLDQRSPGRLILLTSKGDQNAAEAEFKDDDTLLFGRESAGAPEYVHNSADKRLRLPMRSGVRSLNLAISVAMVMTLAYKQRNLFKHLT